MTLDAQITDLERRRAELVGQLASVGQMRPGSLTLRFRRCGTAGCHCAKARRPRTRPGVVADAQAQRQDCHAPDSAGCRGANPGADCRMPAFPAIVAGAVGGQQCTVRSASGGRVRADRGAGRDGEKRGFKAAFAVAVDAEIDALVASGATDGWDFEAFEQATRRKALDEAAQTVERGLNADHSDYVGPTVACACGQAARYAGRRPKTFLSVLGSLTLERAYYHCDTCRAGVCPRDRRLGLEDTSLSPATTRMVGLAAAEGSFAKASGLLWELAGVRIETKQVERTAEALGREVAADERDVVEPAPGAAPTMYLGLDGTGVPVRPSEVEGRRGKPDGSARTREVKLVTVWTAQARDKDGKPVRDPGSVSYNAAVESAASRDTDPLPSAFAKRVYREAQRARLRHRGPPCRPWRRRRLDLASVGRAVSRRHRNRRYLPRQAASVRRGQGRLRRRDRAGRRVGQGPACRVGRRPAPCARRRAALPCQDHARGAKVHPLCVRQPPPDALSAVPRQGTVRRLGRRRGRMQAESAHGSSTPACAGPWPAPTPSSPCDALCSAGASKISGSDEPQTPPERPLTNLSCTPLGAPDGRAAARTARRTPIHSVTGSVLPTCADSSTTTTSLRR